MAATTLTAADLLLIIVPLLAPMAGLFLHNNRLIHSISQRFNDFSQKVTGELAVIRKEANDAHQEAAKDRALIRQEAAKDRALIRQEAKNDWTQLQGSIGQLGADVALIKGVILGTDALRQSVTDQDVA